MDKCSPEYWENLWVQSRRNETIRLGGSSFASYIDNQFHATFRRIFESYARPGGTLLEVGCGSSRWLPYFETTFGFRVAGLDYSPTGCEKARAALAAAGVAGPVHLADMFDPPEELRARFDVVVSMGVVEHFDDTSRALTALRYFLKDGGIVVTEVPNLTGLPGLLQRNLGRDIYDLHVPLSRADLVGAHGAAGFEVLDARYFPGLSLSVLRPTGLRSRAARAAFRALSGALNRLSWALDRGGVGLPPAGFYAPYVFCVGRWHGEPAASAAAAE